MKYFGGIIGLRSMAGGVKRKLVSKQIVNQPYPKLQSFFCTERSERGVSQANQSSNKRGRKPSRAEKRTRRPLLGVVPRRNYFAVLGFDR